MPQLGSNLRGFSIRAMTDVTANSKLRTESWLGRDYLVVPVVCLVEGVVQGLNAQSPELALAEEFGRVPEGWDGRPVVMNHPVLQGQLVSANSPAALEAFQLGMLFNSRVEDKKLKSDAWLDIARIKDMGGEAQTTLDRINAGETVEVSTGLFTGIEETSGRFNSKDYSVIWRGVIPDHLAFLSAGSIGACSIDDGCGTPRVNQGNLRIHESALIWQECGCKHGKGNAVPTTNETQTTTTEVASEPTVVRFHAADPKKPEFDVARLMANSYPGNMLDTDVRNLVNEALRTQTAEWTYIIGFTQTMVIYESWSEAKGQYLCFQRTFDISADNKVTLGANAEQVHITMSVSPVTANQGTSTTATTTSEDAQPKANGETEMPNDNATPAATGTTTPEVKDNSTPATTTTQTPAEAPAPAPAPTPSVQAAAPRTLEQYISDAPPAIQAVLNSGLKMLEEKKNALIKGLKSTNRCTFDDKQLQAMDISVLEQLTDLAALPRYEGKNPGPSELKDNSGFAPEPPALIPAKTA